MRPWRSRPTASPSCARSRRRIPKSAPTGSRWLSALGGAWLVSPGARAERPGRVVAPAVGRDSGDDARPGRRQSGEGRTPSRSRRRVVGRRVRIESVFVLAGSGPSRGGPGRCRFEGFCRSKPPAARHLSRGPGLQVPADARRREVAPVRDGTKHPRPARPREAEARRDHGASALAARPAGPARGRSIPGRGDHRLALPGRGIRPIRLGRLEAMLARIEARRKSGTDSPALELSGAIDPSPEHSKPPTPRS